MALFIAFAGVVFFVVIFAFFECVMFVILSDVTVAVDGRLFLLFPDSFGGIFNTASVSFAVFNVLFAFNAANFLFVLMAVAFVDIVAFFFGVSVGFDSEDSVFVDFVVVIVLEDFLVGVFLADADVVSVLGSELGVVLSRSVAAGQGKSVGGDSLVACSQNGGVVLAGSVGGVQVLAVVGSSVLLEVDSVVVGTGDSVVVATAVIVSVSDSVDSTVDGGRLDGGDVSDVVVGRSNSLDVSRVIAVSA